MVWKAAAACGVCAIAMALGASSAAAADYYVDVTAAKRTTAGGVMAVTARPRPYFGSPRRRHLCRAVAISPKRERVRMAARPVRSGAVARWRARIPVTAAAGTWDVEVRCTGARLSSAFPNVRAAVRRPALTGFQWRSVGGDRWAWAVNVTNRHPFALEYTSIAVAFRDGAGRFITRAETDEMIVPARSGGWIGGEISIEGEQPATAAVKATGTPSSVRVRPLAVRDARAVFEPETEFSLSSLFARAEYQNVNRVPVSAGRVYAVLFDPAGVLVRADWTYDLVTLPPGATRGFEHEFFGDGGRPDAAARVYPTLYEVNP